MRKGVSITLSDEQQYILPAMNGAQFERLLEFYEGAKDKPPTALENYRMMFGAVGGALRRNYPDMTDEKLKELVESTQLEDLFNALVEASGLQRRVGGDAQGETRGGAAPGGSSGQGSSLRQDGQ